MPEADNDLLTRPTHELNNTWSKESSTDARSASGQHNGTKTEHDCGSEAFGLVLRTRVDDARELHRGYERDS